MSISKARGLLWIGMLSLFSCHVDIEREVNLDPYTYEPPVLLDDSINTTSAATHNIDTNIFGDLVNKIRQGEIVGVDSMLVSIDNDLVLEEYFAGWGREDVHDLRSATKSITSLLAGIAIDQQLLQLDMPVYEHFKSRYPTVDNWSPNKEDIQLRHFMDMSSGLACNDSNEVSPGNESRMYRYRDWVKFILDLPMVRNPNVWFSYCTGGVQLVARTIEDVSGMSLGEFARENLFESMGIKTYQWAFTGSGRTEGSGHIFMRSRDMLKLGLLVSNNGQWNGQQLVSAQWIEKLHNPRYEFYGYFWWHQSFEPDDASYPKTDALYANGNGGQQIWVFPSLQLVLVFTANNYNQRAVSGGIIRNYILPAVYGL